MKKVLLFGILFLSTLSILYSDDPATFGPKISKGIVQNDEIDEASGIVSSYKNKGILWTHNDSGGENRIYAIDSNGISRGQYLINGSSNRDWEDIAIGPGPVDGLSYIYIGDIGDNDSEYEIKYIYRVIEPTVTLEQEDEFKIVTSVDIISFTYKDGARDAETLMIDPFTKDIFILGKRDSKARLYKLPFPQNTTSVFEADLAAELTFPFDSGEKQYYLTAGDISNEGTEILVKSYSNTYYWKRELDKTIAQTMLTEPLILESPLEPIAEAIAWKNYDDNGFYRIDEEKFDYGGFSYTVEAELFYYPREIITTSVKNEKVEDKINLGQNFPNPFNPSTTISYYIPKKVSAKITGTNKVELKIYDILGNEIVQLVNEIQPAGAHKIEFNGSNLSSGVYYYSIKIGNYLKTKKMVILK